jgi:peptidoglycan/LPS O-acetylase OafA/YrhL
MGLLRVLLALSVVLEHVGVLPLTNGTFVGGVVAVQSFFLISGFYMALVLNEKYNERKSFYINRLLRLYPTYWAVLIMATLSTFILKHDMVFTHILNSDWSIGSKLLMMVSNIFIIGSDWMLFLYPGDGRLQFTSDFLQAPVKFYDYHAIPQAWTLPLEIMFYAIAPIIIKNKKVLLTLAILSLICRYFVYDFFSANDPWSYRFFPSELVFFIIGAFSYYNYKIISQFKCSYNLGIIALGLMTLYIINFSKFPIFFPNTVLFSGQHLQFYMMLSLSIPFIFLASKNNSLDRYVGELSYPIYLSHLLIIGFVSYLPHPTYSVVYNVIIYTLMLSFAINHFLQNPIEKVFKNNSQTLKVSIKNSFTPNNSNY